MILIAAYSLPTLNLPSPWLLPLGIATLPFSMADYYPLVPWLGVVYLGIYLGSLAYPRGTRTKGSQAPAQLPYHFWIDPFGTKLPSDLPTPPALAFSRHLRAEADFLPLVQGQPKALPRQLHRVPDSAGVF